MRLNHMWRRFFAMAAAVVLAVAAMLPAAAMADVVDDLASTPPAHEKTLTDNGDGTYDLTLSVVGDAEQTEKVKPVDIVLVVDTSTSMNLKIDGIKSKTRMQAAHDAAAALAKELLTAENANLPADQQTRISVVTFGVTADLAQGYSTNAEDISKAVPTKAKYFEGTNWEAALILANEQLGDRANAEKHVIFLSDGDPTLRMSAEGYGESGIELNLADGKNPDGTYGTRVDDPNGRNLSAATRVAKGRPASSMYVVNTSKSATKMSTFAEKTGGSLLDGATENNLAAAFSQIGQVIKKSVSYQDVTLTDQLSSWVEFASADDGSVGNIRYTKNGNDWTAAPPAKIDGDTLTWNLGELDKGATYSVTFTIRPNAQAKADVASKGVDTSYETNKADTSGVAYKTVVKTLEGDKVSDLQKSPFNEKPVITLTAPAAATVTLSGTKTLKGRTIKDDEFTFKISAAEGSKENTPLPDETAVTNAGGSITFGTITFTKTGTYLYDVVEDTSVLPEGVSAVTEDPQRVEVKVTLGDDGALEAETSGELKFVNTYSAKPAAVSLKATKVLKGAQLTGGAFTFELLNNDEVMDSVTNDAGGNIAFKELALNKAGTYTFKIVEVAGDKKGMTYDATEHTVTVEVDDNGQGQLVVTAIKGDNPTFTNTYVEPVAKPESTDKPDTTSGTSSTAQIPKTGDANMVLPTALCLIAVACIGVGVTVRRKNK
mgnify:FL=1